MGGAIPPRDANVNLETTMTFIALGFFHLDDRYHANWMLGPDDFPSRARQRFWHAGFDIRVPGDKTLEGRMNAECFPFDSLNLRSKWDGFNMIIREALDKCSGVLFDLSCFRRDNNLNPTRFTYKELRLIFSNKKWLDKTRFFRHGFETDRAEAYYSLTGKPYI